MKTWSGQIAAELVYPIAKAFLTIQGKTLLELLKTNSASGFEYLEEIQMEQWCNLQWITSWKPPPQL